MTWIDPNEVTNKANIIARLESICDQLGSPGLNAFKLNRLLIQLIIAIDNSLINKHEDTPE